MEIVLEKFEDYLRNGIPSGKARSYRLAIRYLCEFISIDIFDKNTLDVINNTCDKLRDYDSYIYKKCLDFLQRRGQTSYLLKGWINAAVNHFNVFINI